MNVQAAQSYHRAVLQDLTGKVSVVRLLLLSLLMIPIGLQWAGFEPPYTSFHPYRDQLNLVFLLVGFGLSLVYLLIWKRFTSVQAFLSLHIWSDTALTAFLVWMTGGVESGFAFFFLVLVFLYGRLLGVKTAVVSSVFIFLYLCATGIIQLLFPELWDEFNISPGRAAYMLILQGAALALVSLLVKIGRGQEKYLTTKLLEKEKALERSEELKRHILDWMESGLLLVDQDQRISAINAAALKMAGLSGPQETVNMPVTKFFPFFSALWEDKAQPCTRCEIVDEKNQAVYGVRVTKVPEDMELIIFMDITSIKRLQHKVDQMEKMAVVGELAAGLAHEIKNPLAGIRAGLQLLDDKGLEPELVQRLGGVITRDIDRLNSLLKDFLIYARPIQGEKAPISLERAVQDALSLSVHRDCTENITVDLDPNLDCTSWIWDHNQLQQVLINLLVNAAQALQDVPQPCIRISITRDPEASTLIIRDNGPGFDPSLGKKPFAPFFTTKPMGTGLGLAIAQRLAAQNDSVIELKNYNPKQPDSGAQVCIHYFGPATP